MMTDAKSSSRAMPGSASGASASFERKVRLSRAALVFERLWPRVWALLVVGGLFVAVSLLGVWQGLAEVTHGIVLGAFALAALAALVWMARTPAPTREEAVRRLERRSGVPHRPASAYEDTLTASADDPVTAALWRAHKTRMEAVLAKLRVGNPSPRADKWDPVGLRVVLLMALLLLGVLVGDSAKDRLRAAFRFGAPVITAEARLDAWVTPPPYTGRPPIVLADGSRPIGEMVRPQGTDGVVEVPQNSALVVRVAGVKGLAIEVTAEGKAPERIEAKPPEIAGQVVAGAGPGASGTPSPQSEIAEIKLDLKTSAKVQVLGAATLEPWQFKVIPDTPPKIALTREPEPQRRGSLKLTYKIEDDYGVVSAEARITRLPAKPGDPATEWARRKPNTGPRPPLERPPVMALRLPRANAKEAQGNSYLELGGHPWAGMRVRLQLTARDQAGQTGRSEPREIILPQRHFENPIARAVVEQRRLLVEDPRNRAFVLKGLEAISYEPDGYFTDRRAYLGLRSAYWRLKRDRSRATMKSVVDQLWHVAVRLEDGDLSDAERALREAQEKVSQALKDGASDEEIRRLMQELRQALNKMMEQMARQQDGQPQQPQVGQNNIIRQQDLERMMRDIENMARQGSRDMAQQMLSQLRDLLEQLQNGRMAQQPGQSQQGRQMMEMMNQFGDIIGKQQQLLDDTFGEQRRQQDGAGQEQQGQQGQQGRRGQRGQRGQGQERGLQQGEGQGQDGLGQRQGELRNRLGQLRQGLGGMGMKAPDQLESAERSMQESEDAMRRGDLDGAARAEQEALEQLRQGAQQMAQQMMQQLRQFGQGPAGDAPLDPLGRPQRSEGQDLGSSVKVPDEIDTQRAREILEELRRRFGEPTRPALELDYIDRLLKRF